MSFIIQAMIIDSHTHVFAKDVIADREQYCSSDGCFGLLYSHPRAKLLCIEDLINSMDEKGIAKSAILNIGWETHDMCVRSNDYILDSLARFPSRLAGFCSVQPLEQDRALDEIERCHKAGAKGLGELRPDVQGYDLCSAKLFAAIAQEAVRKNMMVILHASEPVGHTYAGKGSLTPDVLFRFIQKFPDLRVIMAHFGGGLPFYELMPEVSAVLANVYYDTAAAPFLYQPRIYTTIINIIGSRRLLFGSDWPLIDQARVLEHIKLAGLSPDDVNSILFGNAEKLLW